MKIDFQNECLEINNSEDLENLLLRIRAIEHAEIWMRGPAEQALCILLNGQACFMMVLEHADDSGRHSLHPLRSGEPMEEFYLSNGQLDQFPAEFTYSRSVGVATMAHYFETGALLPEVEWEYD